MVVQGGREGGEGNKERNVGYLWLGINALCDNSRSKIHKDSPPLPWGYAREPFVTPRLKVKQLLLENVKYRQAENSFTRDRSKCL